ncbi:glyoxalase superfamily protein [Pseudomonas sp. KNUC1026]|uniref:glyoxalase superfamily protein n=1 Tax=Pseudomonas sp. KNUC1026 TaxID=2893890 RepID=UPI003FA7EAE9
MTTPATETTPSIAFERAVPVLRSFDEAKAREFYLDFLGFSVEFRTPLRSRPALVPGHSPRAAGAAPVRAPRRCMPGATVLIPVQGLEALRDELQGKAYGYARPEIVDQGSGRTLEVADPFGNRLRFYQD